MQAQEYLISLTKRNDLVVEDKNISQHGLSSTPVSSDEEAPIPTLTHAQKLQKMHKSVSKILKKTHEAKEHLKFLRQEVEDTCEELKNEPDEGKNASSGLDISEISSHETENVWDEIKNLELQVKLLKEKVRSGEESIKFRKQQGNEIKDLIKELEGLQNSKSQNKVACCNMCVIF